MSSQFGRWSFDGDPTEGIDLTGIRAALEPSGPDGTHTLIQDGVLMVHCALHTTSASRGTVQPFRSASGCVISWDGVLDNRQHLLEDLGGRLAPDAPDVEIVAASFERWGRDSFARLLGDWALSIWNARERALYLAKDFLGSRHLYYCRQKESLTWSSHLEPLVRFCGHESWELEEEYLAGWLANFPSPELTPYAGIRSVPPGSYTVSTRGRTRIQNYWQFDPGKRIRYSTDAEYEDHFRTLFAQSVRRRLESDRPVLAELSGGMDSSSIVCVADDLIKAAVARTPRLDTISYIDNSEPNWNELPFIAQVERQRGHTGHHIDVSTESSFGFTAPYHRFAASPASIGSENRTAREYAAAVGSSGYHVVLSGTGGDETTGGVPTPIPELSDIVASGHFIHLAQQLKLWALAKRRPWTHLLGEVVQGFVTSNPGSCLRADRKFSWLETQFRRQNLDALQGYNRRLSVMGPRPSFQENLASLYFLRRQLAIAPDAANPAYLKRYPFLDRDLLEFLYAIPRTQLVRPQERRSLLRRALKGTVPEEVLGRRRKAFANRGPLSVLADARRSFESEEMISERLGILDRKRFLDQLVQASEGQTVPAVALLRLVGLESWLAHLEGENIFSFPSGTNLRGPSHRTLRVEVSA